MPADNIEIAFRKSAAIHRINQREVSDFLDGHLGKHDVPMLLAQAFDFFCRRDGAIVSGPALRQSVGFVLQVIESVYRTFRRTDSSLRDLRTILDGGTVEQLRDWIVSNM